MGPLIPFIATGPEIFLFRIPAGSAGIGLLGEGGTPFFFLSGVELLLLVPLFRPIDSLDLPSLLLLGRVVVGLVGVTGVAGAVPWVLNLPCPLSETELVVIFSRATPRLWGCGDFLGTYEDDLDRALGGEPSLLGALAPFG
jgi:hypothetical protein